MNTGQRRLYIIIFITFLLILFPGEYIYSKEKIEYQKQFNEICNIVEKNFYNQSFTEREFPAIKSRYYMKLPRITSSSDFSSEVNNMLLELNASHTHFYMKNEPEYYQLASIFSFVKGIEKLFTLGRIEYPSIGISTRLINKKRFIISVLEGSPAERAGFLKGDEIISADGKPFHPFQSFKGRIGKPVSLEIKRTETGNPFNIKVIPASVNPQDEYLRAERSSAKIYISGGKKIGYIHIWDYAGEMYHKEFLDILGFGILKDADALILDLRDGWGGANPEYLNVFNKNVPAITSIKRNGRTRVFDLHWRKPVAMLINNGTRSGKEILAFGFKKFSIGKVIGEKTAGALLGGSIFSISDGSLLYLAVQDIKIDGERLEGKGVEPDIEVPMDIRYLGGKDMQVEKAVEYLTFFRKNDQIIIDD